MMVLADLDGEAFVRPEWLPEHYCSSPGEHHGEVDETKVLGVGRDEHEDTVKEGAGTGGRRECVVA